MAAATLLPMCLAALLAPPVPWPLDGRLYDFVDHVGHHWHYWDAWRSLREGGPLLSSTRVFFPEGADHLLHRGGQLLVALAVPLLALGKDPAFAQNALTLLALATTAAAGALLGLRCSPTLGAMLAGACGLSLNRALYRQLLQGQAEEVLIGLPVLFLLALEAAVRRGGWRIAGAGLLGALCLWANLEFGLFLALILGLALPVAAWGRPAAQIRRGLARAAAAAAVAGVLAGPLAVAFVLRSLAAEASAPAGAEAFGAGFVALQASLAVTVPSLWGGGWGGFHHAPSLALLGLAALGLWRAPARERALWGGLTAGAFALSLGPWLTWPGVVPERSVPLPLLLLDHLVPFAARMHFPARFLALAHIGLAALAAWGAAAAAASLGRRRALGLPALALLGLFVGFEQLLGTPVPAVVPAPGEALPATAALAADDDPFAVIEVPSFQERGGARVVRYLQRCQHGKPTLDAMGGPFLLPAPLRALREEDPLLDALGAALGAPRARPGRPIAARDVAALGDIGFRHVVVFGDELPGERLAAVRAVLDPWLGTPRALGADLLYTLPTTDGAPARIGSIERSRAALRSYLAERAGGG